MRRTRSFAAPFVVTLAACSGHADTTPPPRPPPLADAGPVVMRSLDAASTPVTSGPADAMTAAAGVLVYDGYGECFRQLASGDKKYEPCTDDLLPVAPADAVIYAEGDQCKQVPAGTRVRCPPGGGNVILPTVASVRDADGNGSTFLQYESLICEHGQDEHCPPHIDCNPPAPQQVPCPAALLPHLAKGVKPTRKDKGACYLQTIVVACP